MKTLSIDIETFSSENLTKCGVYRYAEAPDFEVLLFGYSADGAPVQVVDLTAGETLPADVRSALTDPAVTKWAFNAQFERVCLSRYLGYPTGQYLDPSSWHCTMVWAATLGLPLSLEGVGAVLGLEKQKLKEGKDLIRYFCTPAKARDGSPIRHYPTDALEKWSLFKAYNLRDVETEMSIQQKLSKFPVTESEWRNYTLDQQINDRGIMLDRTLVTQAIRCDERFKRTHMEQARSVTGLDNPNSPVQLKAWLAEKGVKADPTLAVHAGQFFRILSTDYVKLYDGVTDLLEALKKTGKKIYLLSNAQRIFTEYEMHTLGIAKYFDDIFISSTCGVKKPDSRFFQLLIDKYNLDITKSIMIGNDGISDIAGAKSVGLDTFYIHSNISPKLPEETVILPDGTEKKRKIVPDADFVLDGMDMERVRELLLGE